MKKTMAQIIKQRIKLFLKEKYMDVFFEILRNIEQIIKEEEDNKIETIFHKYYKDKNYHPTTKEKVDNYFIKLKNSIFTNNEKYKFSNLSICYLKKKAKIIKNKCNLISIEYKKKIESIVEYYIKLCKRELEYMKEEEEIEKLEKERLGKYYNKKIHTNENEDDEIDNEEKIINLFIGNFDISKLNNHKLIKIKKSKFVNAYLFTSDENDENNKLQNFYAPTKSYFKHKKNEKKIIKNEKFKNNIFSNMSKFQLFKNHFNQITQYNKNYIKKDKLNKNSNYISHYSINSNEKIKISKTFNNNNKKQLKIKLNDYNNNKDNIKNSNQKKTNTINSLYSTNHKTLESFPNIGRSVSHRNNKINLTKKINDKFYLKKEDLYY